MKPAENINIAKLIQYCLGYIKLINPSLSRYTLYTDPIEPEVLSRSFLEELEVENDEVFIPLKMEELYSYNPSDVPEELADKYKKQKKLASKLEEIRSKFKVNEYTKQINLNFGYLDIEIPADEVEEDEEQENKNGKTNKGGRYPLFSIPIDIQSRLGADSISKYYIALIDLRISPNIGFLQPILGEDLYDSLATYFNKLETDEVLSLPMDREILEQIWGEIKAKLRLSKAVFNEDSFDLTQFVISLGSKSNFFVAQDMMALSELKEEDVSDTALSSWISEEDMSVVDEFDESNGELFFPLPYDKYQLKVLSIMNNRAAIVQGPPGTGKSQTIANLLCHLAANNKRVLFLSQKDQAIRGVKDRLKSLDIKYLYGYIPNRHSPLYSPEDERDGAAFALSGIQQYINGEPEIGTVQAPKNVQSSIGQLVDTAIDTQREFYELHQALADLSKYDLKLANNAIIIDRFNAEEVESLFEIDKTVTKLQASCSKYASSHDGLAKFEQEYSNTNFSKDHYFQYLDTLINEYDAKGFDRKGALGRSLSNTFLKLKNRETTSKLPREIFDAFTEVISSNDAVSNKVVRLSSLRDFCYYKDCLVRIEQYNTQLDEKFFELGFGETSWKKLKALAAVEQPGIYVSKIEKRMQTAKKLSELRILNPNLANEFIYKESSKRQERIVQYLRNRINRRITEATQQPKVRGTLQRISRALLKSKKAYKTFDLFKSDPNNFNTMKEIIPIWMMDLEDVSRLIPLEKNQFDYIILDEASQCNLAYALPSMYRSKHVLFFGDTEQMRDSSIKFKTNRSMEELAKKYDIPEYLQIKSSADAVKSVMDIGLLCGFKDQSLLYHYRSPKELIGFSNSNFYAPKQRKMEVINSNYLTYGDTNRVLVNHFCESDKNEDISDKTNIAEARYINKLIQEIRNDPKNEGKSIGVLTFFNEQAILLRELIADDSIKVSIIEGIQGDERDIIIYSLVIASADQKKRYVALTSEGGEINKELSAGRVNVAFSRARLQVHCVTSLPVHEWPDGIWIKRYLEYVEENGEVNFYDQALKPFDSKFEEDFYYFLKGKLDNNFIIQNQVVSCGFVIDFVITDQRTGKQLAIECDGPTHFMKDNPEVRVSGDYEREAVLISAGWTFDHVLYSDWLDESFDKDEISSEILGYFSDGNEKVFMERGDRNSDDATKESVHAILEVAGTPSSPEQVDVAEDNDDDENDEDEDAGNEASHSVASAIRNKVLADSSPVTEIRAMQPGKIKINGTVERIGSHNARTKNLVITEAIISDGTGSVKAIWFNKHSLTKILVVGRSYCFTGTLAFKYNDLALQSPMFTPSEELEKE